MSTNEFIGCAIGLALFISTLIVLVNKTTDRPKANRVIKKTN